RHRRHRHHRGDPDGPARRAHHLRGRAEALEIQAPGFDPPAGAAAASRALKYSSPSIPIRGRRRMKRGSHQFRLPSRTITDGTRTHRTIEASIAIAAASPRPNSLTTGWPLRMKLV